MTEKNVQRCRRKGERQLASSYVKLAISLPIVKRCHIGRLTGGPACGRFRCPPHLTPSPKSKLFWQGHPFGELILPAAHRSTSRVIDRRFRGLSSFSLIRRSPKGVSVSGGPGDLYLFVERFSVRPARRVNVKLPLSSTTRKGRSLRPHGSVDQLGPFGSR